MNKLVIAGRGAFAFCAVLSFSSFAGVYSQKDSIGIGGGIVVQPSANSGNVVGNIDCRPIDADIQNFDAHQGADVNARGADLGRNCGGGPGQNPGVTIVPSSLFVNPSNPSLSFSGSCTNSTATSVGLSPDVDGITTPNATCSSSSYASTPVDYSALANGAGFSNEIVFTATYSTASRNSQAVAFDFQSPDFGNTATSLSLNVGDFGGSMDATELAAALSLTAAGNLEDLSSYNLTYSVNGGAFNSTLNYSTASAVMGDSITIRATDTVGNAPADLPIAIDIIDQTPPAVAITDIPTDTNNNNNVTKAEAFNGSGHFLNVIGTCSHPGDQVSVALLTGQQNTNCQADNTWSVEFDLDQIENPFIELGVSLTASHKGVSDTSASLNIDVVVPTSSVGSFPTSLAQGDSFGLADLEGIVSISDNGADVDSSNWVITGIPVDTSSAGSTQNITVDFSDAAGNAIAQIAGDIIIVPNTISIDDFTGGDNLISLADVDGIQAAGLAGDCSPDGNQTVVLTSGSNSFTTDCNGSRWSATFEDLSINLASLVGVCSISITASKGEASATASPDIDVQAPVLQLSGENTIDQGATYDLGDYVSVSDNCDASVAIVESGDVVDSSVGGASYTVNYDATDASGNAAAQQSVTIAVQAVDEDRLEALHPQAGEQGVVLRPIFQWDFLGPNFNNDQVDFDLRVLAGQSCDGAFDGSIPDENFSLKRDDLSHNVKIAELATGVQLIPSTEQTSQYYAWCVRAQISDTTLADMVVVFTTQAIEIPVLSLSIDPDTRDGPSGQTEIRLFGSNGESGQTAVLYEQQTDGAFLEVASTQISTDGSYQKTLSIPFVQDPSLFTYQARMKRDAELGEASENSTYSFDPQLTIEAPSLVERAVPVDGQFEITNFNSALTYSVWKRTGYSASPSDCSGNCFGDTPFQLSPSVSITQVDDSSTAIVIDPFYDASSALENDVATGTAYFVTASDGVANSPRSNAITFADEQSVTDFATSIGEFQYIVQSYGVEIFACGVAQSVLDTNPDLDRTTAYWTNLTGNCGVDDVGGQPVGERVVTDIDVLARVSVPEFNIQDCIYLGAVPELNPATGYCFNTCLRDNESNDETCQSGFSDQTTNPDTTAPGFNGLESVTPLTGDSVEAFWSQADADSPLETLQYQVFFTSNFQTVDGVRTPIFDQEAIIVDNVETTQLVVPNLLDNTEYAFKVEALDQIGNRTDGNSVINATTFRDAPEVRSVTMRPTEDATIAQLCYMIYDRQEGDQISITRVAIASEQSEFARAGTQGLSAATMADADLIDLGSDRLRGIQGNAVITGGNVTERCDNYFVGDIIRSQQFSGITGLFVVEDSAGRQGQSAFTGSLVDEGSRNINSYSTATGGGLCAAKTIEHKANRQPWIWLVSLLGIFALILFRRPIQSRRG